MNKLQVGFARVNITPQMGIDVAGYYKIRKAEGVLDDLEINAVAVNHGETTVLIMTIDNCNIPTEYALSVRNAITTSTGIPSEAIYIHATHTHTGPRLTFPGNPEADKMITYYRNFVITRFVDVANFAITDLKPAKMGYAVGTAPKRVLPDCSKSGRLR